MLLCFAKQRPIKIVIAFIRKGSSYNPLGGLFPDCLPSLISRDRNVQDHAAPPYNREVESQVEKCSSGNITYNDAKSHCSCFQN